jgi:hypothetical protein
MDVKNLLKDIADEVTAEKLGSMSQQDRIYHAAAQRLLMLERDLLGPGAPKPTDVRVERLLEAIEKENF